MTSYSNRYHTIVLGVGGMGSAAIYELARRGKRVLGLEQFDIPNMMGSSHGYTRIIRKAYYEDPAYVMLIKRAYELWEEIERRAGKQLLYKTGSLDAGPADSWVFKGSQQSCVDHNLDHEVLTGREINRRFPGYNLPEEIMGVYQPDGGFLVPEDSTVAFVEAAHRLGAEIHGRETVLEWQPDGEGVLVKTDRDQYLADRLVITGGAWNEQLLPILRGLALPERQVLAWLQPDAPGLFTPERFPVFNLLVPEGRYYGFPVHGVPGFKFGKYHHFEEIVDPDYYQRDPTWEDEDLLRNFASRYFPQGAGPTMSLVACMFTNSPDNHFIIDLHPEYPQVSFATGFSGHGYKFASVIGEIMADLADWGRSRHDLQLFNLARFTGQVSELYRDHPGRIRTGDRDLRRQPRALPRRRTGTRTATTRRIRETRLRSPRSGPPSSRRNDRDQRTNRVGGQILKRTRTRPLRPAGPMSGSPLGSVQQRGREFIHQDYRWDTTDPRFWEKDDVQTFW
jgi:sarcosine oxidase